MSLGDNTRPDDPYGGQTNDPNTSRANPTGASTFGGAAATRGPNGEINPSSAENAASAYRTQANNAASTPTQSLNYGGADTSIGRAQWDEGNANSARNQQQDALGLSASAARGQQPSQAELLGRNQIDQGLKSQLAGAASARGGPLATMSAQRNVQQGAAAQTQQGANSLAAMRAGEMANARSAYAGQAGDIRSGDYTGQGLNNQAAGIQANMAQGEGSYEQQQRELNAKREMGYQQLGYNTQNDEANRGVQRAQLESTAQQHQIDVNQGSKRDAQNLVGKITGGVGGFLGGLLAKGGPASGGQPYLVGEKGPELIVPRHDGYVMTADQTADILAHARHRALGGAIDGPGEPGEPGEVNIGGSSGISGSQVQQASTGRAGGAEPMRGMVGGGGVTGGAVHLGMPGGGGGSGHGLSYGARASGGPVAGSPGSEFATGVQPPSDYSARTWGGERDVRNPYEADRPDITEIKYGRGSGGPPPNPYDDSYVPAPAPSNERPKADRTVEMDFSPHGTLNHEEFGKAFQSATPSPSRAQMVKEDSREEPSEETRDLRKAAGAKEGAKKSEAKQGRESSGGGGGEREKGGSDLGSGLGALGSGLKRLMGREEGGRVVGFDRDSRSLQDAHANLGKTFRDQARKGEKVEGVSETERPERDGWGGALRHLLTREEGGPVKGERREQRPQEEQKAEGGGGDKRIYESRLNRPAVPWTWDAKDYEHMPRREEGGAVSGIHEAAKSGALGAGGLLASHLSQDTRDRLASAAHKANDMGVFGMGGVLGHLNHEKQLKPLAEQAAAHGALGGGAATGHAAYAATAEPVKREGGGVVEGGEIEDPLPHKGAGLSLSDLGGLKTREPTSFVHHPRASQSEISRDKMKEADRLIASYDRSLGHGAAVARDEGEVESAPGWLDAYMAKEREEPQKLAYAPRKGR